MLHDVYVVGDGYAQCAGVYVAGGRGLRTVGDRSRGDAYRGGCVLSHTLSYAHRYVAILTYSTSHTFSEDPKPKTSIEYSSLEL